MTIRVLIVDDEELARQRLRRLLAAHPDVAVAGELAAGDALLAAALEKRPDLVLLDVAMPGMDGLAALAALREHLPEEQMPLVVFTTAYEEHALRAFELEGLDYLVKPVEASTLGRALRRARRALGRRPEDAGAAPAAGAAGAAPPEAAGSGAGEAGEAAPDAPTAGLLRHLAAHRAGRIIRLDLDAVAAIVLEDTIAFACTAAGRLRLRQTLAELEPRLPGPPWLRVSRAAIVNLDWVDHLDPFFHGRYLAVLRDPPGLELPVSRRRARRLREQLGL